MCDKIEIPKIVFNDDEIKYLLIKNDAKKHFHENSTVFLKYIIASLDGQHRQMTDCGYDGIPIYKIASATNVLRPTMETSDFRDTIFKVKPDIKTIEVFHFSQKKKTAFEKLDDYFKIRID